MSIFVEEIVKFYQFFKSFTSNAFRIRCCSGSGIIFFRILLKDSDPTVSESTTLPDQPYLEVCWESRIVRGIDDLQVLADVGHVRVLKGVGLLHGLAAELHDLVALRDLLVELGVHVIGPHSLNGPKCNVK